MLSNIRTIAVLTGVLVAGLTYGLVSLRNIAQCGTVACGAESLLLLRHYLLTVALPFTIGYCVALFALAVIRK